MNGLLGGWQTQGILVLHSGLPFTPTISRDVSNTGIGGQLPNRIGSGKLAHKTINEWFNVADFVAPTPYTFGNSGRNFLYGPDYKNVDLTLAKNFSLPRWERATLQLRADAFNALNHTNFGNPNSSIGVTGSGVIHSSGAPRTMQIGARFSF